MQPFQFPYMKRHAMPPMPGIRGMVGGVDGTPIAPYDVNQFPALNTSLHSPYDVPFWHKLPPGWVTGDIAMTPDGAIILGAAIRGLSSDSTSLTNFSPVKTPRGPYGDMVTLRFVIPALGSLKVLNRPTYKRLLLQVQNKDAVNDLNYKFGGAASANDFGVPPGGSSSFLQAVPQNELWLFSTAGAAVVVGYVDSMTPDAPSEKLE